MAKTTRASATAARADRTAIAATASAPIVSDLPLYLQLQRIGGKLTPQEVSSILQQADSGYTWRLVDLANEARQKDCHLHSVLQTRELALAGLKWQVVPGGGSTRLKDRKAAEFCEEHLRAFADFPRLLSHLVGSGRYHGFAVSELQYGVRGGAYVPMSARHIPCRRFVFDLATGQLRQWDATGGSSAPYPGVDLQAVYPGRFIQFQPRTNGDIAAREGLSRVLVWAALWRNWTVKDWLALGEIAWKPYRTGTYEPGADRKSIDNLTSILRTWSSSGVCVVPKTTEVKVDWPAHGNAKDTHGQLFSVIGAEISKAVLGQTLTTEQGSRGSQALGRVHDGVRGDILEADACEVAAVLMRDVLAPMVRMNFGPDHAIPEFQFLTEDAVDIGAYAVAIKNLRDAGLEIAAKDVRGKVGLSEPDEDDELLGDAEPEEDVQGAPPDAQDPNAKPEDAAAGGTDEPKPDE